VSVVSIFVLLALVALAFVLASNAGGVASILAALGNAYSSMLRAAEGR
jgi:hypothetical protein